MLKVVQGWCHIKNLRLVTKKNLLLAGLYCSSGRVVPFLTHPSFSLKDAYRITGKIARYLGKFLEHVFLDKVGGCTQFAHGRSRMTVDPHIPTIPGRSTSGFHRPGRHSLHQAQSAVRCSASGMRGEVHPSKNRS